MSSHTDTDDASTSQQKKGKEKEVTVIQSTGFFRHSTGDTYEGFFEARKKDKSVRMHGPGTYTTNEGDSYTGIWENDKFGFGGEEVTISYHSGAKYEGFIKDFNYHGKGRYTYPDGSMLACEFENNSPIGLLTLTDPNGHIWQCKAEQGFAWLEPVNHYYSMLDSFLDKAEIRKRRKEFNLYKQPPVGHKSMPMSLTPTNALQSSPSSQDQKKRVRIGGQESRVLSNVEN